MITTLTILADQDNTERERENIARAITNIAATPAGRIALIANPNVISTLTTLADQVITPLGREMIARAIANISISEAGITALLANIVANSDDNILKVFITIG